MEARGEIGVTLPRSYLRHGHLVQWAVRDLAAVLWEVGPDGPVVLARGEVLTMRRMKITEEVDPDAGRILRWAWATYWD
jgi:hypothetical protein